MKELLMGNEAIAVGAIAAGVQVVSGYPGTPSSEVLETIAERNPGEIHVEWSTNEKAGVEIAVGAAYAGARSLVTMKQMGLNVAADPVMCVNYIGVKGGMIIYVCDDPGPISSQTEQDSRHFAQFAHIPCFDCNSPEQAFQAVQDAFVFSEKHETPVILRSTTRVCHACADIEVPELRGPKPCEGFIKDSKWVIFPKRSYEAKKHLVNREALIADEFSEYQNNSELDLDAGDSFAGNTVEGTAKIGIACGGISYAYVKEAIAGFEEEFSTLKISTPYPFPSKLAREFMGGKDTVIVFEELDPVIEDALLHECAQARNEMESGITISCRILGKRTGDVQTAGELSAFAVAKNIQDITGIKTAIEFEAYEDKPELPLRPPVLCAGCPHRGAFYAVKAAVGKKKAIYCGDIGCYTLGNAAPLDMVDTCLCMGAGVSMAQGLNHADHSTINFAFVGDSTFFASGITGVVNAVYNQSDMILCVLDNSTTAMTGHQPHPGMGITMMGEKVEPIDIAKVLEGIGVKSIRTVDPLDFKQSINATRDAIGEKGVRALIFKSPCIALFKAKLALKVDNDKCVSCMYCIEQIGCPALITDKDKLSANGKAKAFIDKSSCVGCGLCAQICPAKAIR